MKSILDAEIVASYGVRKEATFRLSPILAILSRGYFSSELSPHVSSATSVMPPRASTYGHYPFWIVPTKDIKALLVTQAARLIVPLEHLFRQASPDGIKEIASARGSDSSARLVLAYYTAELLYRLLVYTLGSEKQFPHEN